MVLGCTRQRLEPTHGKHVAGALQGHTLQRKLQIRVLGARLEGTSLMGVVCFCQRVSIANMELTLEGAAIQSAPTAWMDILRQRRVKANVNHVSSWARPVVLQG